MMRTVFIAVILLLLCAVSLTAVQRTSTKPQIHGVVLDSRTNTPIAGARVFIYQDKSPDTADGPVIFTTSSGLGVYPAEAGTLAITDRDGRFEFENLESNSFKLSVERKGYDDQDTPSTRVDTDASSKPIVIKLDPTRDVTAAISGKVRDSLTGKPLAGISVELLRRKYSSTGREYIETKAKTRTNDLGEYRMYWVQPGRYYVAANGNDGGSNPNRNVVHMNYGFSLYPGAGEVQNASVIDLKGGRDIAGVDFNLVRQLSFRIRGRVVDSSTNQPPRRFSIQIENHAVGTTYGYSAANGIFEISELIPGTYELTAQSNSESGKPPEDLTASAIVVIKESDVDDLLLRLQPITEVRVEPVNGTSNEVSSRVSGRIKVEGGLPNGITLNSAGVRIQLNPVSNPASLLSSSENDGPAAPAGADGTFTLNFIPEGTLRVGIVWMPPGFYLKEALLDGEDALARALPFMGAHDLEIVLSSDGGQLIGDVSDGTLQGRALCPVVLVPNAMRERVELFKMVHTDKNGHYIMSGIEPGDYMLYAWDQLEDYEYFDSVFLDRFKGKGTSVHVPIFSKQTIDLKILSTQAVP